MRTRIWLSIPAAVALTAAIIGSGEGKPMERPGKVMQIRPRYLRLYTDPGVELTDSNYKYAELDWKVPLDRTALVCVDCWAWHFSRETMERTEEICRNNIAPLLAACRQAGMLVIHAPADPVASKHPNWVKLKPKDARPQAAWPDSPVWPPAEFRGKTGPYAQYARPFEPQDAERNNHRDTRRAFHELVKPVGQEPVVLDGEELHRLCAQRKILQLFYIGFNTNACIMMRDYGVVAMSTRGYEIILVRDCTTGMESAETARDLTCTRGTIVDIEQFIGYSVTSKQLVDALTQARAPQ